MRVRRAVHLGLDDVPRLVQGPARVRQRRVPWEFCLAEWNAQFLGDRAYQISETEKTNLRWEAEQFRAGNALAPLGLPAPARVERLRRAARVFARVPHRQLARLPHLGRVGDLAVGVRRTSGSCATAWTGGRKELPVDWDHLQRPGFSPDYVEPRYGADGLAFERSDWVATAAGAGPASATTGRCSPTSAARPARFTSKDHNFLPGETVEKQLIVLNNSRETVDAATARGRSSLPRAAPARQPTKPSRCRTGEPGRDSRCASTCRRRSPPGTLRPDARPSGSAPGRRRRTRFADPTSCPRRRPRPAGRTREGRRSSTRRARPPSCWPALRRPVPARGRERRPVRRSTC